MYLPYVVALKFELGLHESSAIIANTQARFHAEPQREKKIITGIECRVHNEIKSRQSSCRYTNVPSPLR